MDWTTVLIALASGIAAVLASAFGGLKRTIDAAFDRLVGRLTPARVPSAIERLSFLAEFNALTNSAKRLKTIDRCLVFVGHNCGGLPEPGNKYTVKAQTGWSNGGDDVYRRFDFEIPIDKPYADLLWKIHEKGIVVVDAATMEDGLLKDIYRDEGVTQSVLYGLGHDPDRNEFAYCSFATYQGQISMDDRAALTVVVARLRGLLAARAAYV